MIGALLALFLSPVFASLPSNNGGGGAGGSLSLTVISSVNASAFFGNAAGLTNLPNMFIGGVSSFTITGSTFSQTTGAVVYSASVTIPANTISAVGDNISLTCIAYNAASNSNVTTLSINGKAFDSETVNTANTYTKAKGFMSKTAAGQFISYSTNGRNVPSGIMALIGNGLSDGVSYGLDETQAMTANCTGSSTAAQAEADFILFQVTAHAPIP